MSTLLLADLHLSDNERDYYRFENLRLVRRMAREHGVTRIIVLGDLTEQTNHHDGWLVNAVVQEAKRLAEIGETIFMTGNHDGDPDLPFFQFVQHIPNLSWVTRPAQIDFPDLGSCLFLPHTMEPEGEWRCAADSEADYIFAHNTFMGAVGESGRPLAGIDPALLPRGPNTVVLSGDVHTPHSANGVTYVGAHSLIDFGDDYHPRLILLHGRGHENIRSIPFRGRQKRLITMLWPCPRNHRDSAQEGDIVKVRVTLVDHAAYAEWPEIRRAVTAWCEERGLVVHMVQPVVSLPPRRALPQVQHRRQSDEEIVREFARHRSLDEATLQTGLDLCQ